MRFDERLNDYLKRCGCSAKELAAVSGLSEAAISRYRAGERTPDPEGGNIRALARGIADLSDGSLSEQAVLDDLLSSIDGAVFDYALVMGNLKTLLSCARISNSMLARELNFDASYISRVFGGQRRPADMTAFLDGAVKLVVDTAAQHGYDAALAKLVGGGGSMRKMMTRGQLCCCAGCRQTRHGRPIR